MRSELSEKLRYILFFTIVTFVVTVSFFSTQTNRLPEKELQTINNNWNVTINDTTLGTVSFPTIVEAEASDKIVATNTLNQDFNIEQTILIRGSLQNVIVKLDGDIIYDKNFEDNVFNTYASIYHFVNIPDNSAGKTIEISLMSPFNGMSGTFNDIHYGNPTAINYFLLNTHGLKLYTSLLMFVISILFTIVYFAFFKKQHHHNLYLGFFGIFLSLWLFAESRIVQLYINNDFLIGSLAYISLAASPIAAVAFLKSYVFKNDKHLFSFLCIVYVINIILVILLHVFGIAAFFVTVASTTFLISLGFIVTITSLTRSYVISKDKTSRNFLFVFLLFSIFLFLEVSSFVSKRFDGTSSYITTGIFIILIVVFISSIISISKKLKDSYEKQIYEEIAHTDQLTKAKSRFAFETDFDRFFYESNEHLALIYFDFDDLKYINDHYGHIEGDKTLINGFNCIKSVFGKYGECYRIGGDEFACLSFKIDEILYKKLKNELNEKLLQMKENLVYSIRISSGYSEQIFYKDEKPSDLILKADQHMYLDKTKNKAQV